MLIENKMFWMLIVVLIAFIYLIICKICETISDIKMAQTMHKVQFRSIKDLDNYIEALSHFKSTLLTDSEDEEDK